MKRLTKEQREIYRRKMLIAILLDVLDLLMNGGSATEAMKKLTAFTTPRRKKG